MIAVKVSKNVDDYKENVIGTLDMKKTMSVVKGFAVGAIIMVILSLLHIPMLIAMYIAMPAIGIFIYRGFYEKDGMTYEEAKRLKKEHTYNGANYPCASGNDPYVYQELIQKYQKEHEVKVFGNKRRR